MISLNLAEDLWPERVAGGRGKYFALFNFLLGDRLKCFAGLYRLSWPNSRVPKVVKIFKNREISKIDYFPQRGTPKNGAPPESPRIAQCHHVPIAKKLRKNANGKFLRKFLIFSADASRCKYIDSDAHASEWGAGDPRESSIS